MLQSVGAGLLRALRAWSRPNVCKQNICRLIVSPVSNSVPKFLDSAPHSEQSVLGREQRGRESCDSQETA